jgi:hypothetical protein
MSKGKVGIYAIAKAAKTWFWVSCETDNTEDSVAGIMRTRRIQKKLLGIRKDIRNQIHRFDLLMLRSGRLLLLLLLYRGAIESKS